MRDEPSTFLSPNYTMTECVISLYLTKSHKVKFQELARLSSSLGASERKEKQKEEASRIREALVVRLYSLTVLVRWPEKMECV